RFNSSPCKQIEQKGGCYVRNSGLSEPYWGQTGTLITQITDALGNATSFSYDPNGNLLSVTDPRGRVTSHTYDNMDRPITRTDPLNRVDSYKYDLAGNLASDTDRKGEITS
ncbi:MAG: hypothetical protein WBN92_02930, partial [Terriglobia bacterium]